MSFDKKTAYYIQGTFFDICLISDSSRKTSCFVSASTSPIVFDFASVADTTKPFSSVSILCSFFVCDCSWPSISCLCHSSAPIYQIRFQLLFADKFCKHTWASCLLCSAFFSADDTFDSAAFFSPSILSIFSCST